jgi:hypothetical protein
MTICLPQRPRRAPRCSRSSSSVRAPAAGPVEPQARLAAAPSAAARARVRTALALLSALAVAGCALAPPTVHQARFDPAAARRIVVVAGQTEPKVTLPNVAAGKGEGAARGALGVGGACLAQALPAAGSCTATGPFAGICAAVPLLMAAICGVASVGGAVYGAAAADPADLTRRNLDAMAAQVRAHNTLQAMLAEAVVARGRSVPGEQVTLADGAAAGTDYRLEVELTEVGLTGASLVNDPVDLGLRAQARLVRVGDGSTVNEDSYLVRIGAWKLRDWTADGSARFAAALEAAYRRLGAHIFDQLVLLQPVPMPAFNSAGLLAFAFGLAPEYPRMTGTRPTGTPLLADLFGEWPTVPSPTPTLRWQVFPTAEVKQQAPELAARLRRVRYDLVIARESNLAPEHVVYLREGLPEPQHTLELPLEPGARYFWTVRARFELDGRERVIDWGSTSSYARVRSAPPSAFAYRFQVRP